jgi:hypothetical protein
MILISSEKLSRLTLAYQISDRSRQLNRLKLSIPCAFRTQRNFLEILNRLLNFKRWGGSSALRDMRAEFEILRDMSVKSRHNDPRLRGAHVTCAQIFTGIREPSQILRGMRVRPQSSRDMH